MKKTILLFLILSIILFTGCAPVQETPDVIATTKPVYDFTSALCQGTDIRVTLLVTEELSCLHDYTLQVRQMRALESAQTVVMSGAGLEDFLRDALANTDSIIDASEGITLLCGGHDHEHSHDDHHHEEDPHIWLDVDNAKAMAHNICKGLSAQFPEHKVQFENNLTALNVKFDELTAYGEQQLSQLSTRQLITFHDGFSYFAQYWDLEILHSLEEESGSEASAAELKELIGLVQSHNLPAIFIEENGSFSASNVVSAETGAEIYTLNMAMSGKDYFESMRQNIDNIKEALG